MGLEDENSNNLSRREFLKIAAISPAMFLATKYPFLVDLSIAQEKEIDFKENGPNEITTLAAILAAKKSIGDVPYQWEGGITHCSGFVGRYFKHLGFNVSPNREVVSRYTADPQKPMPDATTVKQVEYLRKLNTPLGGGMVAEVPVTQVLKDPSLWEKIPPGTTMYLPEPIGQHGYDTYTHTTIFMGLDSNNNPLFSEFSPYMKKGPEYGIDFRKFAQLYRNYPNGVVKPYYNNTPELNVFLFDTIEASRRIGLENGAVTPDVKLFSELGFDYTITINTNDGTVTVWEISPQGATLIPISNKEKMYSVVGRYLKKNSSLSLEYMNSVLPYSPSSMYDSAVGCHIDKDGIRRTTYTPPIITNLIHSQKIPNFGNLGNSSTTDIFLLKQYSRNKRGEIVESDRYSNYTLHEVPRGTTNQEVLLRESILVRANSLNTPPDKNHFSSGCVNLDANSWQNIKSFVQSQLDNNKKISVMFTTPDTNQAKIIKEGEKDYWFYENDPFGQKAYSWAYGDSHDNGTFYKRKTYELFNPQKKSKKEEIE